MKGWIETTIGEHVELSTGEAFQSARFGTTPDSGTLLARGDNVKEGYFEWGEKARYWPELTPELERYLLREGDVLLGMDGSKVGKNWVQVRPKDLPCLLVQRVARLRTKPTMDQWFLRYLIGNLQFQDYVARVRTGTSIPHISGGQIKSYEILLPPLPEQRAIASVLGALDDKVELNRRMNATLEGMARALFQSWFVDFDPVRAKLDGRLPSPQPSPIGRGRSEAEGEGRFGMDAETAALFAAEFEESTLGMIPKGWEVCPLSEKIQLLSGGTPKTSEPTYWDGDIPWYSVRDVPSETDVWVIQTDKHVTKLGIANSAAQIFPEKTTIISARGTVGKLALTAVPMAMNQSCYGVRGISGYGDYFTYYLLREATAQLQQRTHGTVFDTITTETFKTLDCVFPMPKITAAFDSLVEPLLGQIRANLHESLTLAILRDTLLPKLLSGELSVEDIHFKREAAL
jgi:type I restriction enzyme S subunit